MTRGSGRILVRNAEHEQLLAERLRNAKGTVRFVSPWVTRSGVDWLLSNLRDGVELQFAFRWPKTVADLAATDVVAIDLLRLRMGI